MNRWAAYWRLQQQRPGEAIPYYEKAMSLLETDLGSPNMLLTCYAAVGDIRNVRRSRPLATARERANGRRAHWSRNRTTRPCATISAAH